ncbi:hypothetical protein chiPu_0032389, partial [Chiloscyllium punctatum]|nr:hypothetical protein [Chiloscyllium punctatum]
MRGERVDVIDHKRQMRRRERLQALFGASNEQDRGDLCEPQVVFRIVEAKPRRLADQFFVEGDRLIEVLQWQIAPHQDVEYLHCQVLIGVLIMPSCVAVVAIRSGQPSRQGKAPLAERRDRAVDLVELVLHHGGAADTRCTPTVFERAQEIAKLAGRETRGDQVPHPRSSFD